MIEQDGRLFPVEVEVTTHPDRRATAGLAAFRATCGELVGPGLVVCAVDRPFRLSADDVAVPWDLMVE